MSQDIIVLSDDSEQLSIVVTDEDSFSVVLSTTEPEVIQVELGEVLNIEYTASAKNYQASKPLSGGRLVCLTPEGLDYYDAEHRANMFTLLGISQNAADANDLVTVESGSVIKHIGWTLLPGMIYFAGPSGFLVLSGELMNFSQVVGRALNENTLIFSPQTIYLI